MRKILNLFIFTGVGPDGTKYKTAYKCEGEKLTISCAADQTIKVIIVMMMMIVIIVMMMTIINITFSGSLNIFQICSLKGDPSKLWSFLDRDLQSARDDRHERQLHVPRQQQGHEEKVSIYFPSIILGANICPGIILSNLQTRIMFCAESR